MPRQGEPAMNRTHRRPFTAALLCAAAVLGSAGCASGPPTFATLTYETTPEGAELFEGGKSLGMAPVTRQYPGDGKSASVKTPDVVAQWPSGAKASYFTVVPLGSDRVATIERPPAAPGLQADLAHAKKVVAERERGAQRTQADIARDQARQSARCKESQAKGSALAALDCN